MKIQHFVRFLAVLSIVSFGLIMGCSDDDNNPVMAPTVGTTTPENNATNVPRNNSVEIEFTEEMDPTTMNSSTIVVRSGTTVIPGTVTYSGTTAVFTPTDTFLALTAYTVTVTTDAKTLAGVPFAANSVTSFTTGGSIVVRSKVELGSALNYVIVAKTAINNSATSAITGDLGLSPAATSYITGFSLTNSTGFATSSQVTGKIYAADMVSPTSTNLTTTVNNMTTAYNDAAGRVSPDFIELGAGNIGSKTLTPGLYKWSGNVTVPTSIVLSGGANDVWIFQIAGNLETSAATNMTLTGGALAKNIFWQVAGQVTMGTTSHFEGIILSQTGITMLTGASLDGQMLAQTAVILDSNAVTKK